MLLLWSSKTYLKTQKRWNKELAFQGASRTTKYTYRIVRNVSVESSGVQRVHHHFRRVMLASHDTARSRRVLQVPDLSSTKLIQMFTRHCQADDYSTTEVQVCWDIVQGKNTFFFVPPPPPPLYEMYLLRYCAVLKTGRYRVIILVPNLVRAPVMPQMWSIRCARVFRKMHN